MDKAERDAKRAALRAAAGVSLRGAPLPAEDPATSVVNAAGAATTDMLETLLEAHGGHVGALACILEGVMLNVAWHLWLNAGDTSTAAQFKAAFMKLAKSAGDEVVAATENAGG